MDEASQVIEAMNHSWWNCIGGCGSGLGFFVLTGIAFIIGLIIIFFKIILKKEKCYRRFVKEGKIIQHV